MPKFKATPESRAAEFKSEGLYTSNKILFCKWCNCRVDYERRDTVVKHVQGKHHIKVRLGSPSTSNKRLATLEEVAIVGKKMKEDRENFILETTEAFISANIPLEKLDDSKFRDWINKNVKGGGDIPSASSLRRTYIPKLGEKIENDIKKEFEGKDICVLCDETTDKGGRCVFNILFKKLEPASNQTTKLVASTVLDAANYATCSKAILDTLAKYGIGFDSVKAIVSDSAPYMTKCFNNLSGLLEHAVHLQCWAHKMHLVGNTWQTSLTLLNKAVAKIKKAFLNSRKRKHHYLSYLSEKYGLSSGKVKVFPEPVLTRWNSWFRSVVYICSYFDDIIEFFASSGNSSLSDYDNSGITWLKERSSAELLQIKVEAKFVSEYCKPTEELITFLEGSSYATAHILCCKLNDIETKLQLLSTGQIEQFSPCMVLLEQLSAVKKAEELSSLKAAAVKAHSKLQDLRKNDSAAKMFLSISVLLNPRNIMKPIPEIKQLQKDMNNIPFIKQLALQTFLEGFHAMRNTIVEDLGRPDCSEVDMVNLLCSLKADHSDFASGCLKAIWLPTSNVDSERSFSQYSLVVSDRRRNLLPANAEILTMVNFN